MNKTLVALSTTGIALVALRSWAKGGVVPDGCLQRNLANQNAIVTGGAGGIGRETALQLAKQGCRVTVAARDSSKTKLAVEEMRKTLGDKAENLLFTPLDLSSLKDVARFCQEWQGPLNLLINSAGIMALPTRQESVDGHELQLATNVLGHHLLTKRLLPTLIATAKDQHVQGQPAPVRIINVASRAHRVGDIDWEDFENTRNYSGFKVYGDTKLANIMHANQLAAVILPQELQMSEQDAKGYITANSLHPGVVKTGIGRYAIQLPEFMQTILFGLASLVFKTPWEGAQTTLFLALCPEGGLQSGGYWADCLREDNRMRTRTTGLMDAKQQSRRESEWKKLWDVCESLTQSY